MDMGARLTIKLTKAIPVVAERFDGSTYNLLTDTLCGQLFGTNPELDDIWEFNINGAVGMGTSSVGPYRINVRETRLMVKKSNVHSMITGEPTD